MLDTDLQHGVRRGRFLRSERIARRYGKGDKSCPDGRKRFTRKSEDTHTYFGSV